MTGVRGISSRERESNNLCGIAEISDTDTYATVEFTDDRARPRPEPDSAYHVVATVNEVSGPAPTGALAIHVSNKETTGFRINVAAAPGAGNQVTVAWILIR